MKAMIFAAGLGTRLAPLTNTMPKALVPVHGRPMLEWVIRRLISSGFDELIINLHHFARQIGDFLEANHNFGAKIHLSYENELLDTGGGIKQAARLLQGNEPFIVHNADILSGIDLGALYKKHIQSAADVTLAVRARSTSRYLLFDSGKHLCGWKSLKNNEKTITRGPIGKLVPSAFCGIHIISPYMIRHLRDADKFSIIKEYLRWAPKFNIYPAATDAYPWADLGTTEKISAAEKSFPISYFDKIIST